MNKTLTLGTRGSKLALWQTHAVAAQLRTAFPDLEVDIQVISTQGDKILDVALSKIGDKGLFTKELERALLEGSIDACVHSMKDLPSALPDGCALGAMLERADARDVLVFDGGVSIASLDDVPAGSRIGTGSLRRAAQLQARYPHIVPKEIRGNVDTRLAKAETSEYDGVLLAAAGLKRLGLQDRIACFVDTNCMVPAVGQGAIGVEIRSGDTRVQELLDAIRHKDTETCVQAERYVLAALEGGCQVPIGAHAHMHHDEIELQAIVLSLDGAQCARATVQAPKETDPTHVGQQVVESLESQDARSILQAIARDGE